MAGRAKGAAAPKPLAGEYREIPLVEIATNEWNPNEMNDKKFQRLVDEIAEDGMLVPIQVVPVEETPEGHKYRILGGENRYFAADVNGYESIAAVVLTAKKFQDEDLQRLITVRLNVIAGDMNPERMVKLYERMADKYGEKNVHKLMGYVDRTALDSYIKQVNRGLKDAGAPEAAKELQQQRDKIRTPDDLGDVMSRVMGRVGAGALSRNHIFFSTGGKRHLVVSCDRVLWSTVQRMMDDVSVLGLDANAVFKELLSGWEQRSEVIARARSARDD